jgi:hypothetical protein
MRWDTDNERRGDFALEHDVYDDPVTFRRWYRAQVALVVNPTTGEIAVESYDRHEHGRGRMKRWAIPPPFDFRLEPSEWGELMEQNVEIIALPEELIAFKCPDDGSTAWWYFGVWVYARDRVTAERAAFAWFLTHRWSQQPWGKQL